jgi:hypothetical protein
LELIVEIWQIWTPFFPRKILCIGRSHIFQAEFLRKFTNKKTLMGAMSITFYFIAARWMCSNKIIGMALCNSLMGHPFY